MSTTKTVLVVGGSGFLGTHFALKLRERYKVFATYHKHPVKMSGVTHVPLTADNRGWVKRIIYTCQPDVVVYVAGSSSREWCEANATTAERIHSNGPAILASSTDYLQPRFIYVSNPFVFDGMRGNYHENDTVLPGNVLGRTKLAGENVVRSKCLNYIVLRSSPVFGRGNGVSLSYIDRIRMALDRNQRFEASTLEMHSFAPIDSLIDAVVRLVESGVRNRILHIGGLTKMTLYEFALTFAKRFNYDPSLIVPKGRAKKMENFSEETVYDFSLNSTQATELLKIKPFLLEEGLDLIDKHLIPKL